MNLRFARLTELLHKVTNLVLHPRHFWPGLLVALFLVSAGIWMAQPLRRPLVLWFPSHRTGQMVPELRYIEKKADIMAELRLAIEELILGSTDPHSEALLAADVAFRLIGSSERVFYIDFSSAFFFRNRNSAGIYAHTALPPARILELVRKTLRKNYPKFDFIITIDGLEPENKESLAILEAKFDNLIDKGAWLTIIKANTDSNVRAL